jgi:hypothetical protein
MIAFALAFLVLAVTPGSTSASCSELKMSAGSHGTFVFEILDAGVGMTSTTLCEANGSTIHPVVLPEGGRVADISSDRSSGKVVVLTCSRLKASRMTCAVVGVDSLGRVSRIFPPQASPYFEGADGRLTPWNLTRARVSPDGHALAVVLDGRALIFHLPTGDLQAQFGDDVRELVWISGNTVALTKSTSPERRGLSESQVFLYHLDSGREEQITRFPPLRKSSWNPFAEPRIQYPLARGLTWALDAGTLAFIAFPAGDLYELRDLANLRNLGPLKGQCYFQTVLSGDAKQLAYIVGTTAAACLVAAGEEARLRNLATGEDRTLASVHGKSVYLSKLAWATDPDEDAKGQSE